jgi:hypothetical protein
LAKKQNKTKQNKTKQNKTKQNKTKQNKQLIERTNALMRTCIFNASLLFYSPESAKF